MRGWVVVLAAVAGAAEAHGADDARGRALFKEHCAACHTLRAHQPPSFGPTLQGLIGRPAGAVDGYPYSPAMAGAGLVWSEAALDAYLAGPEAALPGTAMRFPGLAAAADRADLIAYLARAAAP